MSQTVLIIVVVGVVVLAGGAYVAYRIAHCRPKK